MSEGLSFFLFVSLHLASSPDQTSFRILTTQVGMPNCKFREAEAFRLEWLVKILSLASMRCCVSSNELHVELSRDTWIDANPQKGEGRRGGDTTESAPLIYIYIYILYTMPLFGLREYLQVHLFSFKVKTSLSPLQFRDVAFVFPPFATNLPTTLRTQPSRKTFANVA